MITHILLLFISEKANVSAPGIWKTSHALLEMVFFVEIRKRATAEARAMSLRFSRDRIVVELNDEREISVPLHRYPSLLKASPTKRSRWVLMGDGQGFHWPELDLDLSVKGLTNGLPEVFPRPPRFHPSLLKARRRTG